MFPHGAILFTFVHCQYIISAFCLKPHCEGRCTNMVLHFIHDQLQTNKNILILNPVSVMQNHFTTVNLMRFVCSHIKK